MGKGSNRSIITPPDYARDKRFKHVFRRYAHGSDHHEPWPSRQRQWTLHTRRSPICRKRLGWPEHACQDQIAKQLGTFRWDVRQALAASRAAPSPSFLPAKYNRFSPSFFLRQLPVWTLPRFANPLFARMSGSVFRFPRLSLGSVGNGLTALTNLSGFRVCL